MIETKIIKAVFGASKSIVAPKRYKHDYGQEIEFVGIDLPDVFEAHFSNSKSGQAKKQIGQDNVVTVPDEYFVSGADVFCWVMVHDEATDGRTMYTVRIPVMERPEPIDVEPTPVQQDIITQAIAVLNDAVTQTGQDVESADASAQSASDSADRAETARDTAEGYVNTVQGYAQQAQASANNASASATASANSASQAQQIKIDVEGMVDEAQSAAGASAQSALESEQSASQASAFATFASQSTETASTKASEASTSAQTASAKATEASGYASTASHKASEASQSASTAVQAKTYAETAKTASETAQGLAETARNEAVSAKTGAEDARNEAQNIADGITGKVEQIDSNTDRIESLEDDRYKPYATDTASGAVASFVDGADNIPLKSCIVQIEPVQEGSGDPSPDNIRPITGWTGCEVQRTGKNLANAKFRIKVPSITNGQMVNVSGWSTEYIKVDNSKTYCVSVGNNSTSYLLYYDSNLAFIGGRQFSVSIRIGAESYFSRTSYIKLRNDAAENNDPHIQLELGSTATDYEPYTGRTYPITFPSEAGAVFGGYVDVINGDLVVDRATDDMGNLSWSTQGTAGKCYSTSKRDTIKKGTSAEGYDNAFAEIYSASNASGMSSLQVNQMSVDSGGNIQLYDARFAGMTGAQIKAELQGVTMCYKLAEPIHYPLTPTEIRSLLGQNNLFADTGDSTAEYRADTKLYIQKKITEAVNALT